MSRPLSGVKVLDLSGYIAAPYACALLADLGAEVVKVEPPDGDNLRRYPSTLANESRAYLGVNRGKRGIVIDLKKPDGVAAFLRLADRADVVVHNFRPGVPEHLGIGHAALSARNPRLIYGVITGYGADGPLKERAGYDQVLQSFAGIVDEQGKATGHGAPEIVYGSAVDFYAASLLAFAVASALFARAATGKGQKVGVSLLAAALAMQSARLVRALGEPRDIQRDMRSGGVTGLHPTRQGYLYLSANTPHFWRSLCTLTGLTELAEHPRYATIAARKEHADELIPKLRQVLAARTAKEWEELFGEQVPCAAVRPVSDMFDHPQVLASHLMADYPHSSFGAYRALACPVETEAATPESASPLAAPTFGQHTADILLEAGFTHDEIAALFAFGAVR